MLPSAQVGIAQAVKHSLKLEVLNVKFISKLPIKLHDLNDLMLNVCITMIKFATFVICVMKLWVFA